MKPNAIVDTIEKALAAAGITPQSPTLGNVATTIRKALADAGLVRATADEAAPMTARTQHNPIGNPPSEDAPVVREALDEAAVDGDSFTTHTFSIGKTSRDYKLFVPATTTTGDAAPLLVMLHGCTQHPDDFAVGTRMNALAQQHGFLVAYPAQARHANGSNCWNWFEAHQQLRSGEEASLIAGIAGHIGQYHRIDEKRVFVAGLSAGGAMALILGATYPEVFAAVGVHSGIALGTAQDMGSAFAAMRGQSVLQRDSDLPTPPVPTIVLHGDADHTVHASNADQIISHARQAFEDSTGTALREQVLDRQAMQGREVTTTRWMDGNGLSRIEQWVVHGAAHAWTGGDPEGTYTDARGPDASQLIVQFFLGQQHEDLSA